MARAPASTQAASGGGTGCVKSGGLIDLRRGLIARMSSSVFLKVKVATEKFQSGVMIDERRFLFSI